MVEQQSAVDTTQNSSNFDNDESSSRTKRAYGQVEMNVLSTFLQATCTSLLDVKPDMFHKELHLDATQDLLKHFVEDQTNSTLVISKVERPEHEEDEVGEDAEELKQEVSTSEKIYDLNFSSTI
jgi:hypothetical protein